MFKIPFSKKETGAKKTVDSKYIPNWKEVEVKVFCPSCAKAQFVSIYKAGWGIKEAIKSAWRCGFASLIYWELDD